jgi:hypothetical protein
MARRIEKIEVSQAAGAAVAARQSGDMDTTADAAQTAPTPSESESVDLDRYADISFMP